MIYELYDVDESYTELKSDDIEFKKKVIDTLSVFEEGYKYSPLFRSGIWDGKKHFYTIEMNHNIKFPKGLVGYIIKDLIKLNYSYSYITTTKNYDLDRMDFENFVKTLELPFEPYDYQMDAAYSMITQRRLTLRSATSSGKSLMAYLFFMYMHFKGHNAVLVVPSINLVDQMFSDFEEYGLKDASNIIKQIGGDHKGTRDLSEKPIVISTWQSLQKMNAKEFEIFDAIVIDECHSAKSDVLNNIIKKATRAKWKLGMTGTIPRTRVDKLQLLGTLGRVKTVITPGGLIARGLATAIQINALYLNYSESDRDAYNRNKPDYAAETKFISQHYYRNLKVSQILVKLAEKGNVLGLFTHIAHGEKLLKNCIAQRTGDNNIDLLHKITPKPIKEAFDKWDMDKELTFYMNSPISEEDRAKILKNTLKATDDKKAAKIFANSIKSLDDINIFFVTGSVSGSDREYIRKNLEEVHVDEKGQGAIVLGNYSVVSTGVNYKNLHSIVYCSSLKSYTKIVQSIGRGMRLHTSKSLVNIYDCVDILTSTGKSEKPNYVLKHFYERIEYYREDEYPITEREIQLEGDIKSYEIKSFDDEW